MKFAIFAHFQFVRGTLVSQAETVAATQATLTVTTSSFTVPYRTPIPTLTYGFSGFVSPDTPSVVSGAPVVTTTATQTSLPGTYPIAITQGTLAAANHTFSLVPGTLTITLPVGPGQCVPFPVTLASPAPAGGLTVDLSSSNTEVATVPATIVIPANQTSVIVTVTAVATGSATIAATVTAPNVPPTSTSLTVL